MVSSVDGPCRHLLQGERRTGLEGMLRGPQSFTACAQRGGRVAMNPHTPARRDLALQHLAHEVVVEHDVIDLITLGEDASNRSGLVEVGDHVYLGPTPDVDEESDVDAR